MRIILQQMRIVAQDQNHVFVELARSRKLSAKDAEGRYHLAPGKGNAYVEFNIEPEQLTCSYNEQFKSFEYSIMGDVELTNRQPEGFVNVF